MEEKEQTGCEADALGGLAGGAAHDLCNVVSGILIQLAQLQRSPDASPLLVERLEEVAVEATRASNLARQLVLFVRQRAFRDGLVDLNGVIQGLLEMLRRMASEATTVEFVGAAEPCRVKGDAEMLEQLVVNLCANAQNVMPKGGRIVLRTAWERDQPAGAKGESGERPVERICLSVTGEKGEIKPAILATLAGGVPEEDEMRDGVGWSYAAVRRIAEQHHALVKAGTGIEGEALFEVHFPAARAPGNAKAVRGRDAVRGGSETVLLVENAASLRSGAALCLRILGYGVFEAGSAGDALKIWEERHQDIDLLLTDMTTHGAMTGFELAQECRRTRKSLKVVMTSDEAEGAATSRALAGQGILFLPKPYRNAALAKIVRQCLDEH